MWCYLDVCDFDYAEYPNNVYHRRLRSESRIMHAINFIAAMSNILSYRGFIFLAMFDVNYLYDGARMLHYVGVCMYFSCAGFYEVLHVFLLWNQREYPMLLSNLNLSG